VAITCGGVGLGIPALLGISTQARFLPSKPLRKACPAPTISNGIGTLKGLSAGKSPSGGRLKFLFARFGIPRMRSPNVLTSSSPKIRDVVGLISSDYMPGSRPGRLGNRQPRKSCWIFLLTVVSTRLSAWQGSGVSHSPS
jgi:hypothetical protein